MSEMVALRFDADEKLSPLERDLVLKTERGEDYVPTLVQLKSGETIRGELIRAMMLGTPLKHHPENSFLSERRAVLVTAHGVRIALPSRDGAAHGKERPRETKGAAAAAALPRLRISGPVDLRDLVPPGGGSLPPVEINGCDFDAPLDFSRSRLHSLTLKSCRFTALRASGTRFDADLVFSLCGPCANPADGAELSFLREEVVARTDGASGFEPKQALAPAGHPAQSDPGEEAKASPPDLGCVITLSSAVLAGGLLIDQCHLRAEGCLAGKVDPGTSPACAVDFSHIRVSGRVEIVRSTVVGAASFISARVGGDVWISGGKFLSGAELTAFNFQLAKIGGVLAFQSEDPTPDERKTGIRAFPVVVVGRINAISLEADEVWIGEGYYYALDCEGWGAFPTINLSKADIGRSFKAGAYHEHHVRHPQAPTGIARIHGEICLTAANIGKNLEVYGVFPDKIGATLKFSDPFWTKLGVPPQPSECLRLTGYGVKVDRRVYISHGRFLESEAAPADRPPDLPIPADPPAALPAGRPADAPAQADPPPARDRRKSAAIDFFKSTIGTGFKIGDNCSCMGAVRLNSCVIGREVVVRCRAIEASSRDQARRGDIPLMLDISETTVRGHVKIGRRVPRPDKDFEGSEHEAVRVHGAVSLENANVQGSVLIGHLTIDLTGAWKGDCPARPSGAAAQDSHHPQTQRAKQQRVAFNLRDFVCGSDLEVHGMSWALPTDIPREGKVVVPEPRSLVDPFYADRFRSIEECHFAVVDLRGLQCGLLRDGFGGEWGLIFRLHLRVAGLVIKGVEPASQKPPHTGPGKADAARLTPTMSTRAAARSRLRWLSFQSRKQRITEDAVTPAEGEAALPALRDRWGEFWERHHCSRQDDFVPQAYEAFSAAYRQAGEDRIAQDILVEKKNYENALRFRRIIHLWDTPGLIDLKIGLILVLTLLVGLSWWLEFAPRHFADMLWSLGGALGIVVVVLAWPYFVALFHVIFYTGFRYGLSPNRALFIFALCIFTGWFGVHYARNGSIMAVTHWPAQVDDTGVLNPNVALVLDVEQEPQQPEATAENQSGPPPATDKRAAATRIEGQAIYARASPCNLNVSSLVYAADVFLPLIDLDQERRCGIRDALPGEPHDRYFGWRLVKALYELLGWIITSLVILTITGVLRRDLER